MLMLTYELLIDKHGMQMASFLRTLIFFVFKGLMMFTQESKANFIANLKRHDISYKVEDHKNFVETLCQPGAIVIQVKTQEEVQTVVKLLADINQELFPDNKVTMKAIG